MRFTGQVYRAHNPEWAWSPLSGEGARRHGGRFNKKGRPALYTSLTQLTAIREASPFGRPMDPILLCQYEVDCGPVFDTRDQTAMRAEKVTEADLDCPDWELHMRMGRTPRAKRFPNGWLPPAMRP